MELNYKTHNLNWLLVVENHPGKTCPLAHAHFEHEMVGQALLRLRDKIFPNLKNALFIAPNRFISFRDYILYDFNRRFQESQDLLIRDLSAKENIFQAFQNDSFVLDELSFEDMDFVTPSLFEMVHKEHDLLSVYILPIKINCLLDSGEYLIALASQLESEEKIKGLIENFSSSQLVHSLKSLSIQRPILSPILNPSDLKQVMGKIHGLKRKHGVF